MAFLVGLLSVTLLLGSTCEAASGPSQNPVQDVINLIERLESKIQREGKEEAAAYDKFACFCKDQADKKLFSITKMGKKIAELAATIKKLTADIETFTTTMEEAEARKSKLESESKSAIADRKAEHEEFQLSKDDLIQGINEILKAQEEVKKSADKQSEFVQISDTTKALLQEAGAADPGDAKAYAFKGGETLKTLEKLHKEFKGKLKKLMEEESENKHTHDMAEGARNNEIMAKGALIIKCQNVIGKKSAEKGDAEKEKGELEDNKSEDEEYLNDVTEECEEKAEAWDARSKRRANELTAISECLGILKGDALGKYGSNKLALAQAKAHQVKNAQGASFLQVSSVSQVDLPRATKKIIGQLAKHAALLKSSTLETLVMALKDSPFDSVKNMIEDLIGKIKDEQKAEEDEIEDCKNDIVDNTKKRAKNGAKMEDEEATIVEETAAIDVHKEEAKRLAAEIAELYKALNEQTELRGQEKKENAQTVKDAEAGLASMVSAIKVLKEFYESSAELVQTSAKKVKKHRENPEIPSGEGFGADEEGDVSKQDEAKGVLGLLGTIKSDYENTIQNTKDNEKDAEKEYNDFKKVTEDDIDDMKKAKTGHNRASKAAKRAVEQAKDDLVQWTNQKKQAEYELSILTPRCLGLGASAEERKKRRKEECKALKDAITILDTMGPAEAPEASEEFLQKRS